jgi:replicative DNA helicase
MTAQPAEVINDATTALIQDDFFVPAHQEIFSALREMYDSSHATDVMTIHQWLTDRRPAEPVGSPGILAQLKRRSEEAKAEPALHNLRESGAIEQNADLVLLLHRPDAEKDAEGNECQAGPVISYSMNIAKQRNGPTDRLNILFHAPYTRSDDPVR